MMREAAYQLKRQTSRLLRPGGRALVLLYHRIADEVSDPYGLCVTPQHFEEHLQLIRELGEPLPLVDLVNALRQGRVPDRAIVLSFDDAYLDNYLSARPLLEKYDVPATMFVTTGNAGREREFWWDELERVFLQPSQLPERLELASDDQMRVWDLGQDATYTSIQHERYRRWHINDPDAPTARHAIFREVYQIVQPLEGAARTRTMDELLSWAGTGPDQVRDQRRAMSPEQVRALVESGLVAAGAHTVNHPALPSQTGEAKRAEMTTSKRTLEDWLDRPVPGFAYPYGLYDDDSVAAAREAGFEFACAGDHYKVRRGTNRFLLPRVDVIPGDGEALRALFRKHLW